ncbi:MAG: hypothetical protein ACR9NN_04285 [Nostochopsis sp.]
MINTIYIIDDSYLGVIEAIAYTELNTIAFSLKFFSQLINDNTVKLKKT